MRGLSDKFRQCGVELLVFLLVVVGTTGSSVKADEDSLDAAPTARRPRIGLVLEGGGALGFAHVGVLKVLEENNIPVDVVTGTSIGSIVGAGYASGLSVSAMEKALTETDWEDLFGERVQRAGLTYRLKAGRNREIYGDTKLGIKDGSLVTPKGLIVGQNILPLFQRLFGDLPSPLSFDDLPLPFRAVTADLETGEAYVPDRGNLAAVVRASMSVPGVFEPVEIDGKVLVDGGITNNLPIDVARKMGAEALIVIGLDDSLKKREEMTSPLSISGQIISLLLRQNTFASRKTVGPQDLLILVDLRGYTTADFAKGSEIMAKGEQAARDAIQNLRRYSISPANYQNYKLKRERRATKPQTVDFVRVKNRSDVSDERILSRIQLKPGDTFDSSIMAEDVDRIFQTGFFSTVRYNLVEEGGKTGVEIEADGKEWLKRFLRLGFALEDNLEGDEAFRLGAAYRHYNLTTQGSYGELQFEIGKSPRVGAEYYQLFAQDSPYFINPVLSYGQTKLQVMDGGDAVAQYDRTEGLAAFYLGRELGTAGEMSVGVSRAFGDLERSIGDASLPNFDYDTGDLVGRFDLDRQDNPDFPTTGYLARLRWTSALEDLGASDSFDELSAAATLPLTYDRTTLILRGEFATAFDNRPVERSIGLGGFLDVSGYLQNQLLASDYYKGGVILFHRFSEITSPIFNLNFFLGGSFELTSTYSDLVAVHDRTGIVSGSAFLGVDTPLLPTCLGFGWNDEAEHSIYLAIGRIGVSRR